MSATTQAVDDTLRYLAPDTADAMYRRVLSLTHGGGETAVMIRVVSKGQLTWARNRVLLASESIRQRVVITRVINGVSKSGETTRWDTATLTRTLRQIEQTVGANSRGTAAASASAAETSVDVPLFPTAQTYVRPVLWSDATYRLGAQERSDAVRPNVDVVQHAQYLSAGRLESRVVTWALYNTHGLNAHAVQTGVIYHETVREADGNGAGLIRHSAIDWKALDIPQLSARALESCRTSANPRALEPGRYETILLPEAASRLIGILVSYLNPAHLGQLFAVAQAAADNRIVDERVTLTTRPDDPDLSYIPFDGDGYPYQPSAWIERGVLRDVPYDQSYAREHVGPNAPPRTNPFAFRLTGGDATVDQMIATIARGLLVSAFGYLQGHPSLRGDGFIVQGNTEYGVWLIEQGKITSPVKNMMFIERPAAILRRIVQLGRPERVAGGHPSPSPTEETSPSLALGNARMVIPPMHVRDFNFTALADAT